MEPKHALSRRRILHAGASAWLTTNVLQVLHGGGAHPRNSHRFNPSRSVAGLPVHAIARQSWLRTKSGL